MTTVPTASLISRFPLVCALLACSPLVAQHVALLPAPVSVAYGGGSLPLRSVCSAPLPANAADEDRFAAAQLQLAGIRGCSGVGGVRVVMHRKGAVDALPMPGDKAGPESREAYALTIRKDGISISAPSSAGLFYGTQTLLQMVEHPGSPDAALPIAEVTDYPALPYRAILMDAGSEGPMLTMDEVKSQLDFLAKWKGNQYFFYSEGNIELKGYELLNPHARFTQQQVREIVTYAKQRHIDVVPAIEMYGHLHDLFRIEKYASLADFAHGVEFDPNNPHVATVVRDWAAQINDLFPSRFVDIGFDETWALSRASEHAGAGSEPYKLFLKQLELVSGEFSAKGKTVLAWADIMVKFPGIVPRLPKQVIALPWWYEAEPDPEYKFWIEPLIKERVPFMPASGVHSWNEIAPDFATTFRNIDTWIVAGRKPGSLGLLNTLWTDNGQMLMRMSWPGIAYGAAAAWQTSPMQPAGFFKTYADLRYDQRISGHMASALEALDRAENALQQAIGQRTMQEFWRDPFTKQSLDQTTAHRDALRTARLQAEEATEHLLAAQRIAPSAPHLESFLYGAQNIDLAGMKFLYALEIADTWSALGSKPSREMLTGLIGQGVSNEAHSRAMDLMDGVSETMRVYEDAWRTQYTPYRMGTALSRWHAELEYWRKAQTNLELLRSSFKTGDQVPPIYDVVHASPR